MNPPTRERLESDFLDRSWAFLTEEPSVSSEILYKFLAILLNVQDKPKALKNLRARPFNVDKLLRDFKFIHQDQLTYNSIYPTKSTQDCPKPCKIPSNIKERIKSNHLYNTKWEYDKKMLEVRQQASEKELEDCTFNPVVNKRVKPGAFSPKVYDKRTSKEKELDHCTFKPKLSKLPYKSEKKIPMGVAKSIERLRNAHKDKEAKREAGQKIPTGEDYENLRKMKVKPFEFLGRDLKKDRKDVLVYVDVNVGNGRKGRIALHEDDDPKALANNFCKTFGLGTDTKNTLEDMLKQQLLSALTEIISK